MGPYIYYSYDRPCITQTIPPHTGIGDPDDTLQNCLSLIPKPVKTVDFIKYVLYASKKLRYVLKALPVNEPNWYREFVMEFCLGNDQITVYELAGPNSGFIGGRFMASARLRKPGTNVDDQLFYGTKDFAIGNPSCRTGPAGFLTRWKSGPGGGGGGVAPVNFFFGPSTDTERFRTHALNRRSKSTFLSNRAYRQTPKLMDGERGL